MKNIFLFQDFISDLKNVISEFEAAFASFESFLTDPSLQKYVENPSTGVLLNFEIEEKSNNKNKFKTWPNVELIFGRDSQYQTVISDIMANIKNGMNQAQEYSQVK